VATPLIRAQVIEELAQKAEAEPFMDFTGDWVRSSSEGFADWLRANIDEPDEPDDRKIYIGFKQGQLHDIESPDPPKPTHTHKPRKGWPLDD
jgi:hypothetical protein